ncbi:hypothetical protein [Campylobacter sp. 2018MI13]|uniref:hypothetical protein n=1 Tax=Campylobacter sp. 2018MI13 TaxID=2836737 RepID=UPI001BDB6B55|nr:hypothetical protein [Campylobacter sp. 2018MI13]MBT0882643.1 hypothetical protein [Campylobacter sp. 2018MI13]
MFLTKLNKDEQLVFLNLITYSSTLARMLPKDEEEIKKQNLAIADYILDYLCELEFICKNYIIAKRWSSNIGYNQTEEFKTLFNNENFSNTSYVFNSLNSLMSNCINLVLDNKYEELYNLPKELKFVKSKELFYLEVLNFYENTPFVCTCKDEFLDQLKYFLKLSDEDIQSIKDKLKNLHSKQNAIAKAKKDYENEKENLLKNIKKDKE